MRLEGGCHCGRLRVAFTTAKAPTELPLRACQCTFCRRHGALTTSDPAGEVVLTVAEIPPGGWYRFGTGMTDFWVCPRCGVYVGAYVESGGQGRAVVNTRALDARTEFTQAPAPMDYGQETREGRLERRGRVWGPARVRLQPR
ncbi:MAG: aldehyde-activating protein [Myxococcaceae bacterium]|nr:MAG: aldehyde-activating protein [Myxococcaceae bacterium]